MTLFAIAVFRADATPPIGAPLRGSGTERVKNITSPLETVGFVLLSGQPPVVVACVDFLGIANDSYAFWCRELAEAAGTTPGRVLLSTVHQHGAPMEDLGAQALAERHNLPLPIMDVAYHASACRNAADAVRQAMLNPQRVTHVGLGQTITEQIASNRRITDGNGKVRATRWSNTRETPELRNEPAGLIDPVLRAISFWDEDRPVAVLSNYATHPMSYYGQGEVSHDFVGMAREARVADDPSVHQVYATGCAGNVAPGKYNDGSPEHRVALANRLTHAMRRAFNDTERHRIRGVTFRSNSLPLECRRCPMFDTQAMERLLADASAPDYQRVRAAFFLSWRQRLETHGHLRLPVLDLGPVLVTLLPGEPFVEYQILAQRLRPDRVVVTIGYGDYGPMYIPVDSAFEEGGYEPGEWAFVGPGCQGVLEEAISKSLCP